MKKFVPLILISLLLLVSCSQKESRTVHAYFMDHSYTLNYNIPKNKLTVIKLPLDVIVAYGEEVNKKTVPETIQAFTGKKADYLVTSRPEALEDFRTILQAWAEDKNNSEALLKAMVYHGQDLCKGPLSSKINRLCSTDLSSFFRYLNEDTQFVFMDCSKFLNKEDPLYSKKYFDLWIKQLLGVNK